MFEQWLATTPRWLVDGVGLGVAASVALAVVFAAAVRWLPGPAAASATCGDGSTRRRAEIRDYLRRIDERYVERYDLDGHEVAFYLPDRDVAITFDAQAYFRLRNADRDGALSVVLCEHEMPGHQLGRRLPFDVPDVHLGPPEATDPVRSAFETLGLPSTADGDAVERAYREKVKEVHPDQGGSREAFTAVREAYATAQNHVERE
ncbi:J domain-containing protein [Halobaculum sp. D14]|uniref:J domain-containing protein n=1 Tax=unclassified Halobaculum TaxID=2640896 RepID=UPI003EBF908A